MCPVTFAALIGLTSGCAADAPSRLLDPANPAISTRWRPPPSPTAGLQDFTPVEAEDWLKQNEAPAGGGAMGGMKGMRGMPGMGGLNKGSAPGKSMDNMPGMGDGK